MKRIFFLIAMIFTFTISAQKNVIKPFDLIIILNDNIITKKKLDEYTRKGLIKSMNQGVPKEKREIYKKLLGDKIDKTHDILTIVLFSKEEKDKLQNSSTKSLQKLKPLEKKLEYVIIANNKIITKAQLEEYAKQGLIKSMKKSVSQKERDKYVKILGDKVGDREFIIKVEILTLNEKLASDKQTTTKKVGKPMKRDRTKELLLNVNDLASDFTVQMVDGTEITLSNLKGKVVFLNYWATWCTPCLIEFGEIPSKILEKFDQKDLVFIPIAIGENKEKASKKILKMAKYGVNFNVGVDPDKEIWNEYATGAIPKSFLIDKNGIIKYTSIGNGEGNVDKLAKEIEKLILE